MRNLKIILNHSGLNSVDVNGVAMPVTVEMLKKLNVFKEIDAEFYPSERDLMFSIEQQQQLLADVESGNNKNNEKSDVFLNIVNLKKILEISKSL